MPVTPLTLYGTRTNSGTLPTANILSTISGGIPASNNTQLGMHYGYGEIYSQGSGIAWPENYVISPPSGNGWLLDSPILEGMQTLLGTWSASLQLAVTTDGTALTADIFTRIYRRSATGTYTSLGQLISRNQTITGTPALYVMVPRNFATTVFRPGDKLYFDVFLNVLTSTSTSPATQLIATMAQTSLGVSGGEQFGTPGYLPEPTLDIGMRVLLQRLSNTKDLSARLCLLTQQTQDIGSRLMLGTAYSTLIMQDNPFVYYRLGDTSGTVARDETFHRCDGTIQGGVTLGQPGAIAGDSTTSMLFDGSSGIIFLPPRIRPETWTSFSVECWFNLSTTTFTTFPFPLGNEWSYGHLLGFGVLINSGAGSVELDVSNGASYQGVTSTGLLNAHMWYHFVGTYDGSLLCGYLNGTLFSSITFTGPVAASAYPITIGGLSIFSSSCFPGYLQEVALYTSTLSAGQVLSHYVAGGHRLPDLATRLLLS